MGIYDLTLGNWIAGLFIDLDLLVIMGLFYVYWMMWTGRWHTHVYTSSEGCSRCHPKKEKALK